MNTGSSGSGNTGVSGALPTPVSPTHGPPDLGSALGPGDWVWVSSPGYWVFVPHEVPHQKGRHQSPGWESEKGRHKGKRPESPKGSPKGPPKGPPKGKGKNPPKGKESKGKGKKGKGKGHKRRKNRPGQHQRRRQAEAAAQARAEGGPRGRRRRSDRGGGDDGPPPAEAEGDGRDARDIPRPREHGPGGGDGDEPSDDEDDDEGDHEGRAESETLTHDPVVEPSEPETSWIQERQVHTVLRLRVQEVPGHAQARRCSLRDPSGARQEAPWDHEHGRAQLRRSYHQHQADDPLELPTAAHPRRWRCLAGLSGIHAWVRPRAYGGSQELHQRRRSTRQTRRKWDRSTDTPEEFGSGQNAHPAGWRTETQRSSSSKAWAAQPSASSSSRP